MIHEIAYKGFIYFYDNKSQHTFNFLLQINFPSNKIYTTSTEDPFFWVEGDEIFLVTAKKNL